MEHKCAGKKYNGEYKKKIMDLYYAGNWVEELSSRYDISEVTIYKQAKAFTPISSKEEFLTPKKFDKFM